MTVAGFGVNVGNPAWPGRFGAPGKVEVEVPLTVLAIPLWGWMSLVGFLLPAS